MYKITRTITIDSTLENIRRIAFDPTNWHTWYANLGPPDTINGDGGAGTIVKTTYQMSGVKLPLTVQVVDIESDPERLVWRSSIKGGVSGQQTWEYTLAGDQIRLQVVLTYEVPGLVLGKLMNALIVQRLQEKNLEQSIANLKVVVEAQEQVAETAVP